MRTLFFFLLTLNYAIGQTDSPPEYDPTQVIRPELREYLQLSKDQVTALAQNIDEFNRWSRSKQDRIIQVRFEISRETHQPTLDPMALGVRYAEIEAICRDTKDQTSTLQTKNLSVLTDNQKKRLAALDDVLKLMPVVLQAQSVKLMDGARYARTDVPIILDPLAGFPIGSILRPSSGECGETQSGYFTFLTITQSVQR